HQLALEPLAVAPHRLLGGIVEAQDVDRLEIERIARRRRLHLGLAAREQAHPESVFQLANMLRNTRVRCRFALSGGGERALLVTVDEQGEVAYAARHRPLPSGIVIASARTYYFAEWMHSTY